MDQAKQILIAHGWTPQEKPRGVRTYLYAARRKPEENSSLEWKYIAPASKIENMTEAQILKKLA